MSEIGRKAVVAATLVAVLAGSAVAVPAMARDLDVQVVDDRVSIRATAVPLSELFAMLDRAAGTESRISPDLESRNISVHFDGLPLDAAVKKIFEGQNLDYIVVGGRRIRVTAVSGVPSSSPAPAVAATPAAVPQTNPFQAPAAPPPVVQTPFGPMVNPLAGQQPANNAAAVPNGPLSMPGQANSPFGANGTATTGNATGGGLFGNTSPQIMDLNKQQPQSQPPFPGTSPTPSVPGTISPNGTIFPNGTGTRQTSPFPTTPFPTGQQ